jgi:O-antigen/teichoic acid export membrane protein
MNFLKKNILVKKDILSSTLVNVVGLVLGFIQGVIVANYLGAEGKGVIAFYLSLYGIIFSISNLGIKQSAAFFLPKGLVNFIELKILYGTALIFGIFILFVSFLIQKLFLDSFFFILLMTLPFSIYTSIFSSIALSKRDITSINLIRLLTSISVFILVFFCFYVYEFKSIELFFVIHLVSHILNSLFVYFRIVLPNINNIIYNNKVSKDKILRVFKKGITYCIPLFIYSINYKIDLLILPHYVSNSEVGVYSIGVGFAEMIWQIPSVLSLVIFSYAVSENDSHSFSKKIWSNTKKLMLVLIPIILVYLIVLHFFIPFAYGEEFIMSSKISNILILGTYFVVCFNILNADLAGRGFPMKGVYVFAIGAIINILLNFILIPYFGIEGSALSSTISYIISTILFIHIYYKITFKIK